MRSPIRKGDKLEHGGEVTCGSPWTEFMGKPLARKGDAALCAQSGPTVIDKGCGYDELCRLTNVADSHATSGMIQPFEYDKK